MVIIQGVGTISVTEPGKSSGTYYEDAKITIHDMTVTFHAYQKDKTTALNNCIISWDAPPSIKVSGE